MARAAREIIRVFMAVQQVGVLGGFYVAAFQADVEKRA
jgi:hypothetical protein